VNEQDRQRKRALLVFEVAIFGYLLLMFGVQLYMYSQRNW
jgi:hypothetical protein